MFVCVCGISVYQVPFRRQTHTIHGLDIIRLSYFMQVKFFSHGMFLEFLMTAEEERRVNYWLFLSYEGIHLGSYIYQSRSEKLLSECRSSLNIGNGKCKYIFPPTLVSKYVTWFQNLRCRPHYPLKMVASYFLKEKARSWTVSTNTDSVKLWGLSSQANIWIIQQENLFWRGSGWKQVKEKMISFKQVRRLNSNSSKNKSICTELSCVLGCSGTNKVVVKTTSTKHRLAVLDLDTGDTLYQAVGVWAGGTFPFPLF